MLECVVNISEGRRADVVAAIAAGAGPHLLDVHCDPAHNRSVLTLAGPSVERAARAVTTLAVASLDIGSHRGVHPRIGVVDVVPFVPLAGSSMAEALGARDRFAAWAADELGLPCFAYGPERSLPAVRRQAFTPELPPTWGPASPHPTAGAVAVGARPVLVAYNLWLAPGVSLARAREVATEIRGPVLRTLGLDMGGQAQVSCNLIEPTVLGPGAAFDAVAGRTEVARAELVGLVPAAVLDAEPANRWTELDLGRSRTIEARLEQAGLDGGRFV